MEHLGIAKTPTAILKGSKGHLHELRDKSLSGVYLDLTVIGFSDTAQSYKTYEEYIAKLKRVSPSDYHYFGLALYENKKSIV